METDCSSLAEVLSELETLAPASSFLALGQTVFWDEPMKAGLALASRRLGYQRRFVAGVHDTDYFAKLPSGPHQNGRFKALPHNDTTTRGLWSAAGEFSTLFGGETVITRETLVNAGLRLATVQRARPNILDEATEAWGWRGIVSLSDHAPITMNVPLRQLEPELCNTLDWATNEALDMLGGENRETAQRLVDELQTRICEQIDDEPLSVAEFYRRLLPYLYNFCADADVPIDASMTSELLRFNSDRCDQPRFELLGLFLNSETRAAAVEAYNGAIRGSSVYALDKFGTGAIPFDLVIPGVGRGTLHVGNRGAVIMTDPPAFLSYKKRPNSLREWAEIIEAKFGPNCAVVGKAVTLIGMLAKEFVFVFHEGASSYVKYSRSMHQALGHKVNPIMRIRYDAWGALKVCCSWLKLPLPMQGPFGTEELCAPSFAARWGTVADEQENRLAELGRLRRPIDLIRYLDTAAGGAWKSLAEEYETLHLKLAELNESVLEIRRERHAIYDENKRLAKKRLAAEVAMGKHFREKIFEKTPSQSDIEERQRLTKNVADIIHARTALQAKRLSLRQRQNELVRDEAVRRVHERRRDIELEAELKRLNLIRAAVISSRGLRNANRRPSAWWFRLVCPDGLWFRETVDSAVYYLETIS
jgi:hypothetical protein